jgi:uncharacterized protein YndB with AHSA1/START domain
MTAQTTLMEKPALEAFLISRTFDAPREQVWKAWTVRARLMQWFGPNGHTMPAAKLDFRPGGSFHYCLCAPDGKETWGRLVYREIASQERIVSVSSFSDEDGGIVRHPVGVTWPLELLLTTTFVEEKDKTILTLRWFPIDATEAEFVAFDDSRESMAQGWDGTFDRLAAHLAKASINPEL